MKGCIRDAAYMRRPFRLPGKRATRLLLSPLVLAACAETSLAPEPSFTGDPEAAAAATTQGAGRLSRRAVNFVNSIGVNVHLSYFSRVYGTGYETIVRPRLRELGVRHLRDSGSVYDNEGWMNMAYGRYRQVAEENDARFTIIVGPEGGSLRYGDMSHIRTLLDYIGPKNVVAFEGLNEHDLLGGSATWATDIRSAQRALWEEIKGDPALASRYRVLGPSIGRGDNVGSIGDLSAWMDYAALHPYPGGEEPLAHLELDREMLRPMNGNRPIIVTEAGYHNALAYTGGHPAVTEEVMGRYMSRLPFEFFDAGVKRAFVYELIDQGTDPRRFDQNFGLLRNDGTRKFAYRALRNIIEILDDPGPEFLRSRLQYTLQGDLTDVRQLLLEKRDGRFYLVLWQAVSSYDLYTKKKTVPRRRTITVELANVVSGMKVYEPLWKRVPVASKNGADQIQVTVPDNPVIIEIIP